METPVKPPPGGCRPGLPRGAVTFTQFAPSVRAGGKGCTQAISLLWVGGEQVDAVALAGRQRNRCSGGLRPRRRGGSIKIFKDQVGRRQRDRLERRHSDGTQDCQRCLRATGERHAVEDLRRRKFDAVIEGQRQEAGLINREPRQFGIEDRDEDRRKIVTLAIAPLPRDDRWPLRAAQSRAARKRGLEVLGKDEPERRRIGSTEVVQPERKIARRMTDQREEMVCAGAIGVGSADREWIVGLCFRIARPDKALPPDGGLKLGGRHSDVENRAGSLGQRNIAANPRMQRSGDAAAIGQGLSWLPVIPATAER